MIRHLLTAVLALTLTGCFSNKSDSPNPGPTPKPPVTAIKGVFRKNAPTAPLASVQGLKEAAATSTVSVTMSSARKYHNGIKLLDGKLLIFGGATDNNAINALASAEVFDPTTELFSPVGSMSVARRSAAYTRLTDGRVVVVGGVDVPGPSVDVYDPATQTWTGVTVANLYQTTLYTDPGAAFTLPGNKVLFFGGQSYLFGNAYMNAQVIDLTTQNTIQIVNPLAQRASFASLVLADGSILITGGQMEATTSADILKIDPTSLVITQLPGESPVATLTITKIGTMTTPRAKHSMIQYPDGTVEVYGGVSYPTGGTVTRYTSVEVINPTTGATSKVGDLLQPRALMQSNLLQNGISLHGGGPDKDGFVTDAQLTYEHGTNISTVTNQMVLPRVYFVSLLMNNGRVLYAGGTTALDGTVTNTAEIFDSYSLIMLQGSTDQVILDPVTQATIQMTLVAGGPVTWTASTGTIDAAGLWTAPKWVLGSTTNPTKVRITATSTTDSTIKASYDATLVGYVEPDPAP